MDTSSYTSGAEVKGDIDQFRGNVSEIHRMDKRMKELEELIRPLRTEISELKKLRMELKGDICNFMQSNELSECAYNDGPDTFVYKHAFRESKKPLSGRTLRDDLNRYFTLGPGKESVFVKFTPIERATSIYNFLMENRETRSTHFLTCKKE